METQRVSGVEDHWGRSRDKLALKEYPDTFWTDAYRAVLSASPATRVAAPESFNHIEIIEYGDVSDWTRIDIVILHKDFTCALSDDGLLELSNFEVVFENAVFYVLKRLPSRNAMRHLVPLIRRCLAGAPSLAFVHIPKTCGTSVVQALRTAAIGLQYFGTRREFAQESNHKDIRNLAGHVTVFDVQSYTPQVPDIFTVVRDPKERFLSAIGHARRPAEDPSTFGPSMRAMRELTVQEFLQTPYALREVRAQSIYVGAEDASVAPRPDHYAVSLKRARNGTVRVFASDRLYELEEFIGKRTGTAVSIGRQNVTDNRNTLLTASEQDFVQSSAFECLFSDEEAWVLEISASAKPAGDAESATGV